MPMTNMRLSAAERQRDDSLLCCASADQPQYPYGLRLHLDLDTMRRLGMSTLPEVGAVFTLEARVEVTDKSQAQNEDGTHASVGLQITDMSLTDSSAAPPSAADVLFGG